MKTLLSHLSYLEKRGKPRKSHFQRLLWEPTTVCKELSLILVRSPYCVGWGQSELALDLPLPLLVIMASLKCQVTKTGL